MSLHESNQPKARQTLIFKKSSQEREKLHVDVAVPRRSAWLGGDHARPRPAVRRLTTSRCWDAGAARAVRSPSAVARGEGGRMGGRHAACGGRKRVAHPRRRRPLQPRRLPARASGALLAYARARSGNWCGRGRPRRAARASEAGERGGGRGRSGRRP